MGIEVKGEEAVKLLELLEKIDKDKRYVPTEEERAYLESVEGLDLSDTQISALPETIGSLTKLQELDLSDTQISALPETIGSLTKLQALSLSGTPISALPETIGNLTKLQELDLSGTPISALPEFIGNLTKLQELDLSGTPISALPESIGSLTKLQTLNLFGTQISTLPESTGNLTNLQELNLSWTQISTLPECVGNLFNLQSLDLSVTPISALPEFIGNLTKLQTLNLLETQISALPESIGNLFNLQVLYLSGTQISALPEFIGSLTRLQTLDLRWTQISALPEFIGSLTRLQTLDLRWTQISALPESIGNLSNLQTLSLSSTQISALPEFIGNLSNLESLDLFGTQISTLPECIGKLSNLQKLDLSDTPISTLPEFIGSLTNLQTLDLHRTQISALPEFIGNLTNLQELYLSATPISALPECIGNLTKLQELALSDTQISALPEFIGNLANLQELALSDTPISTLPDFIGGLTNLQWLDLSKMHLQEIPKSLFDLKLEFSFKEGYWGREISLYHTTLATQPISLFHQPRELIQTYYDAPKTTVNDAKVIFLGDGGVGKSHTIQRLLNGGEPGDYHPERTPGIDITGYTTTFDGHDVDLRIWDFGGQEIMHAMHRCFLTDRTCYVVMVSNRFGNRTQRARYWLKTIDSFAKNCPVILAVNLWDTDEGIDGVNGELLEREFPNLRKIITYSAKGSDKNHFNRLTEAIAEQAIWLDSCGTEFPIRWENIRAALLEKQAAQTPYISKADYLAICRENGETDPQICGWLLEWFNDLGVFFSYHTDKTSGQQLANYQVLDPKWLVNAVYLIINKGNDKDKIEPRMTKDGTISLEFVQFLLENGGGTAPEMRYEEQDYRYILNVMRKFRLSYPVDEESEFIPALCPDEWKKPPQTEGWDSHVTYEMKYTYLPDTVLHRLMIFCVEHGMLEQAWSGGMEISNDLNLSRAIIYLREEDSTLEINAYAKERQKPWNLLERLRSELERINTDLNLEAEDVIVMEGDKQTAHFPVKSVLKAKDRNIPTLYAMDDGELEEYRVNDILGAAFDMNKVAVEQEKAREEKRPMSAGNISYENCTFNIQRDYNAQSTVNNNTLEDAETLLQQVLDHQDVTEQFMDTLLEALRESQEQPVQKLVAEVDAAPKKSRWKTFCGWLNGSAGLAADLVTIAGAIAPHLPEIQQAASAFLT